MAKKSICVDCLGPCSSNATRCRKCSNKHKTVHEERIPKISDSGAEERGRKGAKPSRSGDDYDMDPMSCWSDEYIRRQGYLYRR